MPTYFDSLRQYADELEREWSDVENRVGIANKIIDLGNNIKLTIPEPHGISSDKTT